MVVSGYVFVNKREARLLGKPWTSKVHKVIRGQPHRLVKVSAADKKKLSERSGRSKGVKVVHEGKTYRAFPPTKRFSKSSDGPKAGSAALKHVGFTPAGVPIYEEVKKHK